MFTRLKVLVVSMLLVIVALPRIVNAQDGSSPEPIGLRLDAPPYALHGPY